MRIVIITDQTGFPWGGSEVLWSEAAKRMVEKGHDVLAVAKKWPTRPKEFQALVDAGVRLMEVPAPKLDLLSSAFRFARRSILGVTRKVETYRKVLKFRPDLVVVSFSTHPAKSIPLLTFLAEKKVPFVTVAQVMNPGWTVHSGIAATMRTVGHAAVANFFVSEDNKVHWEKVIGTALPNASVVRNPFQVDRNVKLPWPDMSEGLKLACVGRLHLPSKGQDFIIELLAKEKWKSRNVKVSFYGAGDAKEQIQRLAKDWGCESKIEFKGHVSNISEVWKEHHALLLFSRYEGLPLAVVEAMHCGRIALVTDVAGNREVVDHGRTGFVAKGANIRSIEEAMEEAWERREEWQAMGEAAWQAIREIIPDNPPETFAERVLACVPALEK